jgi:hypothetical protein
LGAQCAGRFLGFGGCPAFFTPENPLNPQAATMLSRRSELN